MRLSGLTIAIGVFASCAASPARADDPRHSSQETSTEVGVTDSDVESVQALEAKKLFLEGRASLERGETKVGCDEVERSHRLVPTLATLLNLGLCHAANGKLATAHDYYRQAEVLATQLNDTERREFAHDEAARLAFRRATLTLRVSEGPASLVEVRLDDTPRAREVWEQPMFIDAGDHSITVESAGRQTWHGSVHVVDGSRNVVVIPELKPQGLAPETSVKVTSRDHSAHEATTMPLQPLDSESSSGFGTGRTVALSVAGAGVVALGASAAYTAAASSAYNESKPFCGANSRCVDRGAPLRDEAQAHATRATVFGIAGVTALAAAAIIWVVSSPAKTGESRPAVSTLVGPNSVSAQWTRSF